ncbi:MAG: hypothetical protein GXP25_17910 [Planctomycetes bacterium]|nr:hypothetical protein [Planctomycetota bacterium]
MGELSSYIQKLDSDLLSVFEDRDRFLSLDLYIGELPSRMELDAPALVDEAKQKYQAFLGGGPAAFEVFVTCTGRSEQKRFAERLESTSIGARHYVFRWDFSIRADLARGVTHAQLHYGSLGSVDSILRIAYALHSLGRGAVLFHSASLRMDGKAMALIGGTGAGKSDLSKRLGAEVFSDELTMIRDHGDGLWIHGTPFHGQFPTFANAKAPLSTVIALRERPEDPAIDTKGAAVRFLMKHAFFFGNAPQTSELLLSRIVRIVESVPVRPFLLDRSRGENDLRASLLELCAR